VRPPLRRHRPSPRSDGDAAAGEESDPAEHRLASQKTPAGPAACSPRPQTDVPPSTQGLHVAPVTVERRPMTQNSQEYQDCQSCKAN